MFFEILFHHMCGRFGTRLFRFHYALFVTVFVIGGEEQNWRCFVFEDLETFMSY